MVLWKKGRREEIRCVCQLDSSVSVVVPVGRSEQKLPSPPSSLSVELRKIGLWLCWLMESGDQNQVLAVRADLPGGPRLPLFLPLWSIFSSNKGWRTGHLCRQLRPAGGDTVILSLIQIRSSPVWTQTSAKLKCSVKTELRMSVFEKTYSKSRRHVGDEFDDLDDFSCK